MQQTAQRLPAGLHQQTGSCQTNPNHAQASGRYSAREKTAALKEIDKAEPMVKDCREYEKALFQLPPKKSTLIRIMGESVPHRVFKRSIAYKLYP